MQRSKPRFTPTVFALLAALVAGFSGAPAGAEDGAEGIFDAATLTLAEAMATARQRAWEVAAAEARHRASLERVDEARGYRLPTVRLQEIWMRTDSPADAFGLTLNQERFSFQEFVTSDPNDPEPVESATTRLEVEMPLYTGGELTTRVEQAQLAAEAAGRQVERSADAAALAAAEAWLLLARAGEQVALLERSLETVDAHVALARAYVEQGMLVRSELLRAEVERARIADLLEEARGGARVARAALAFRLAADLEGAGELPGWQLARVPPPGDAPRPLDAWLATVADRPDLEAARRRARAAELEIEVKKAARLPRLGLVLRGDLVDDTPFGDHGDSTAVIARGSVDLWAGGRHRAAVAAAEAEAAGARRQVEQFAEAVRLEVREAWVNADVARRRHATARSALEAARENERIVEERFRRGVAKTLDLLDASTARREAETRELVARAEAHRAALRLAVAAGEPPEAVLAAGDTRPAGAEDRR